MNFVLALLVLVALALAFRYVMKRVNFKFHDDPPPPLDLKNLGENPKPERTGPPKQKDT